MKNAAAKFVNKGEGKYEILVNGETVAFASKTTHSAFPWVANAAEAAGVDGHDFLGKFNTLAEVREFFAQLAIALQGMLLSEVAKAFTVETAPVAQPEIAAEPTAPAAQPVAEPAAQPAAAQPTAEREAAEFAAELENQQKVSFYEGLQELAEIGLAEEFKALFDEVTPQSLAARLKTNEPCFGDTGALVKSIIDGSYGIRPEDPRWQFWRNVLFYFLAPVGLRKKSFAWGQIKEKCQQNLAVAQASIEAAEFVFETAANPRFVDVLLGDYIAATIQQRGHADSPACLCSAYISKDMYFSSIAEAIQYIKNNAAEFAAVIRKQRAEPLRVPKAAQDVEWRTLDTFEYEGWFDNTSKGGICCFVPRWCLCIDEQGNRTTKVVRLKKDAHTGSWAGYDERTQVYSPDATGRVLLERIQVVAYLHNPNDVPIERALYEARESAQRYGAPQQLAAELEPVRRQVAAPTASFFLFLLALFFAQSCASQPSLAPAPQLAVGETTYKAPAHRTPCYTCLPQPKRRADSAVIAYIKSAAPAAIAAETAHGVPAALSIAVALYESGGGVSSIAQNTNNHFGIRHYGIEPQYIDSPRPYLCKKGRLWRSFRTVAEAYDYFAQTEAINIMRASKQTYTAANFAATGYGGRKSKKRYAAHLQSIVKKYNLENL